LQAAGARRRLHTISTRNYREGFGFWGHVKKPLAMTGLCCARRLTEVRARHGDRCLVTSLRRAPSPSWEAASATISACVSLAGVVKISRSSVAASALVCCPSFQ
jgi:hypothetical protein